MGAPELAHSLTYSTAEQWAQRRNGPFCAIRENTLATALAFVSVRAYIASSFNNRHSNDVLPVPGRLRAAKGSDMTDKAIATCSSSSQLRRPDRTRAAGR
jgi:hypothetical protein